MTVQKLIDQLKYFDRQSEVMIQIREPYDDDPALLETRVNMVESIIEEGEDFKQIRKVVFLSENGYEDDAKTVGLINY